MTTISSASADSVSEAARGNTATSCTLPSGYADTETVPGGFVTVYTGADRSSGAVRSSSAKGEVSSTKRVPLSVRVGVFGVGVVVPRARRKEFEQPVERALQVLGAARQEAAEQLAVDS